MIQQSPDSDFSNRYNNPYYSSVYCKYTALKCKNKVVKLLCFYRLVCNSMVVVVTTTNNIASEVKEKNPKIVLFPWSLTQDYCTGILNLLSHIIQIQQKYFLLALCYCSSLSLPMNSNWNSLVFIFVWNIILCRYRVISHLCSKL